MDATLTLDDNATTHFELPTYFSTSSTFSTFPLSLEFEPMANAQLYKWDDVVLEHVRDGISRRFIAGDREMVAQITLKRGAIVPEHSHESEQLTYVLTGALKFTLDGQDITVRPGELLRIPSWMPHSAEALEDTFELDLFSPIRQDWIDGTDDYFRR